MTSKHPSKPLLGLIALGLLLAVVAGAVGFNSLGVGQQRYDVEFAQAAGLRVGDGVTIAGVPVGTVADQRLAGDRVLVTLSVDRSAALGADTRAAIKLTTLLGARYVELTPAGDGEIADHRIGLTHTAVPYDLQQALDNATATFEQIDAGRIATSLDALANQLDGVPTVLPGLLGNLRSLSALLGSRRNELGALLTGVQQLTTVVNGQQGDLAAIVGQGRDLVTEILARRGALQTLMDSTRRLADQVRVLVVEDRPKIDELLRGFDGLLGSLARHDDLLRNILQILPVPIRNFANASGTGNEVDFTAPAGPLIDSWMCALSGRADQVALAPYFQDCK
ncbi:MCE family protein [Nocardia fluminea]|uniref:Virulence factor Mce-like protein n=1 Tax=Nocardia fluminea TaxID=134984 RepID=A0A2N3VKI3_9NOCA|nr:MCE family protein [Nocardia fluminea]PKV82132.1 virulence factor Mce-like protein [Nocardia fluminea]